ncbi:MAG TPA: type II toxin-antitoxin system RelE/ParE family toxin [Ignavibacteria bacterium]|nr:type II toxin-antitoxin system RelE/ParE family toxin [Ignavibacteria bacterium]
MKIKWTKEALFNIQEIEDFISQDDQTAAINLTNKFISLVEDLFNFPKKGRIVPELSFDQIRETLYKNYRIVYLIKKNSIEILTVFEGHKLLDKENIITQTKSN